MENDGKPKPFARLGGIPVGDGCPVRIMGIINVSPESFFKSSVVTTVDAIKSTAKRLDEEGADILDIGARSTAPYLETEISKSAEIDRMRHAVRAVRAVTEKPISVNTSNASVARIALEAGANILNDTSGMAHDVMMPFEAKSFDGSCLRQTPNMQMFSESH